MNKMTDTAKLTAADFTSDQDVRWCPGCGDYSILKAVRKTLAEVGALKENTVVISGIGCAARFPYYVDSYGFHTIHGRAPAIATGALLANPDLDVWIATGDGDALSIGGNHLMHVLRRNLNCQIILFNNEIYGLTKGQYSPTSHTGSKSPSTPFGSIDTPVNPSLFALGCGARFVARAVDVQQQQLGDILKAAYEHKGASFIEVYQNCHVFNDGVFEEFTAKAVRSERQVMVENGEPLLYGADRDKALCVDGAGLGLATGTPDKALVHDVGNRNLATLLAQLDPSMPVATGVLYDNPEAPYERQVHDQIEQVREGRKSRRRLNDVMREGFTWQVS